MWEAGARRFFARQIHLTENRFSVNSQRHTLIGKQVVIVKNYYPLERDPRLTKLLQMFEKGKLEVTYLGWNRDSTRSLSRDIDRGRCRAIIMQRNAPLGARSFLFLPFWWLFVLRWLLRLEWDVLHVVNFPSITPAVLAAKLKNRPVIYDIEDTTVDQLPFRGFLRTLGIQIERLHTRYVEAVILVDEMQEEEFGGIPNDNRVVIYDSPPHISGFDEAQLEKDKFVIFYAGYLNKEGHLNIESLLEAIKDIEDVKVVLAGEGNLVEEIKAKTSEMPDKIQYIGWIPYDKVLEMSCRADLLFSLRDQYPLTQRYICGSKFLEALMCGKPILVNKGTSTAVKVKEAKCGLVVDAHNIKEIRDAILKLKYDKNLWEALALNSRRAYAQKYSWELMKQKLLNLYFAILAPDTELSDQLA